MNNEKCIDALSTVLSYLGEESKEKKGVHVVVAERVLNDYLQTFDLS